jgi:2-polyprenyl-3-methyl-5-hydroxy-6-metoxy-1,4-benzoquinol methylase
MLEIGFGTGILTYEFFHKGFKCKGVDYSDRALETANKLFEKEIKSTNRLKFTNQYDTTQYDIVAAFEVLEHIENDEEAIKEWKQYIKMYGHFFMSVPCHLRKWGNLDVWAGHFRRYEKKNLINLLERNGFEIEKFYCSGFPFMTFLKMFLEKTFYKKKINDVKKMSLEDKTKQSGLEREAEFKYKKANIRIMEILNFFSKVQRLFYNMDLGVNYIVLAKKIK